MGSWLPCAQQVLTRGQALLLLGTLRGWGGRVYTGTGTDWLNPSRTWAGLPWRPEETGRVWKGQETEVVGSLSGTALCPFPIPRRHSLEARVLSKKTQFWGTPTGVAAENGPRATCRPERWLPCNSDLGSGSGSS